MINLVGALPKYVPLDEPAEAEERIAQLEATPRLGDQVNAYLRDVRVAADVVRCVLGINSCFWWACYSAHKQRQDGKMEVVEAERLAAAEGLSLVPAATATGWKGISYRGSDRSEPLLAQISSSAACSAA